jgi:hypothetical protein
MLMHLDHGRRRDGNTGLAVTYKYHPKLRKEP